MVFGYKNQDEKTTAVGNYYDEVSVVLAHHRSLNATLSKLLQKATGNEDLIADLTTAKENAVGIEDFFRETMDSTCFTQHCPPHAVKLAQRIFDIPELLEMILAHLDLQDLLGVQTVSRQFRDAVESSKTLQSKMTLVPGIDEQVKHFPGLAIVREDDSDALAEDGTAAESGECTITVSIHNPRPQLGSRCRKLPISAHPITDLRVRLYCCWGAPAVILSDSRTEQGITIGDVLDMTSNVNLQHWSRCKFASNNAVSSGERPADPPLWASMRIKVADKISGDQQERQESSE